MSRCKVCGTPVQSTQPMPTGIERKFFNVDVPGIKKELKALNENLFKVNEMDDSLKMKLDKCVHNIPTNTAGMSILGSDFFRTRMGHSFFEASVPQLVKELKRLNNNLEKLQKEETAI